MRCITFRMNRRSAGREPTLAMVRLDDGSVADSTRQISNKNGVVGQLVVAVFGNSNISICNKHSTGIEREDHSLVLSAMENAGIQKRGDIGYALL